MKKTLILLIVILFLFIAIPFIRLEARQGCCSHHGGVCGCRCCDGTPLSAKCAPYYPACNSLPVVEPTPQPQPEPEPEVKPDPEKFKAEIPESEEGCFIATAAYGTPLSPEIDILRDFRDEFLMQSEQGKKFVDFYYRNSPPIANFISEHSITRTLVREIGVEPLVEFIKTTRNIWGE